MVVNLLWGFDTERPYGEIVNTEDGAIERRANLEFIMKLNGLMDTHEAGRTFFILGDYLEKSAAQLGQEYLRVVFQPSNPLIEICQYSYSHVTVAPIDTRPDKEPVSIEELKEDLVKADETIKRLLGVNKIAGLRTPLGYPHRSLEKSPRVLELLKGVGLKYVSSSLRDSNWGINAPLEENGQLRQPFTYQNGLIEIPPHGWQDTAFTGTSKTKGTEGYPTTTEGIVRHYLELFEEANNLSEKTGCPVFVGLCMHPWAIRRYDQGLEAVKGILNAAAEERYEKCGLWASNSIILLSPFCPIKLFYKNLYFLRFLF
ncbi:MAG: hypothetical protein KJ718_01265 [Nanoarchaeota archaeon]|nr:hypothetical protein [Nanoarchaeota archaeon]